MNEESKKLGHSFLAAKELYDLFILETMISPNLQKIVDHALKAESREGIYREAWISGVTWSIIQSKRMQEIVDKIVEKQSSN